MGSHLPCRSRDLYDTDATRAANAAVLDDLPFGDRTDLEHANRGRLAPLPDMVTTADGRPVWDSHRFDFVDGVAPPTANPSLWRQEKISGIGGLFEVADGIYQVRSLDLSNISFVRGETGWIVLDPLITAEVAAAALELVNTHVERRPVTAVVYSHSHADHFGGDTELIFASHHWPTWGHEASLDLLRAQRDTYRYLHDETLRLANHGETMLEIAEELELPPALARTWSSRGYCGSVSHNVKAIYQRYLGFFDGNPANLNPHPPVEAAHRYVAYMGGAEAILERARADHAAGDDRWVAEVVKHVVFADPDNLEARELLADALTQLGYQAESGPWRNFYLTGAKELRDGVVALPTPSTSSPDVIAAMPTTLILDYLAVRLRHREAADLTGRIVLALTDVDERHLLEMSNGVLHNRSVTDAEEVEADATITTTRAQLDALLGMEDPAAALTHGDGDLRIEGDPSALLAVFGLLDEFPFWFDIATP